MIVPVLVSGCGGVDDPAVSPQGPDIAVEPRGVDFGSAPDSSPVIRSIRILNQGGTDLSVDALTFEGSPAYSIADAAVPLLIPPGASVTRDVVWTPAGELDLGTLVVSSSDPGGLQAVALEGSATARPHHVDTFVQTEGSRFDLLFFLDMSGSNASSITAMVDNFGYWVDALQAGVDYSMIVVTDDDACHNETIATSSTTDLLAWFAAAANGVGGSYYESGLYVTAAALAQTGPALCNDGFLRPGVPTLALIVSDEADQSPEPWYVLLAAMQLVVPDLVVSGVVDHLFSDDDGYHEVIEATGGVELAVDTEDWRAYVPQILGTAGPSSSFSLSVIPDPNTLAVTVDGLPTVGWVLDSFWNDIVFLANVPMEGAEIEIEYDEPVVCP